MYDLSINKFHLNVNLQWYSMLICNDTLLNIVYIFHISHAYK